MLPNAYVTQCIYTFSNVYVTQCICRPMRIICTQHIDVCHPTHTSGTQHIWAVLHSTCVPQRIYGYMHWVHVPQRISYTLGNTQKCSPTYIQMFPNAYTQCIYGDICVGYMRWRTVCICIGEHIRWGTVLGPRPADARCGHSIFLWWWVHDSRLCRRHSAEQIAFTKYEDSTTFPCIFPRNID